MSWLCVGHIAYTHVTIPEYSIPQCLFLSYVWDYNYHSAHILGLSATHKNNKMTWFWFKKGQKPLRWIHLKATVSISRVQVPLEDVHTATKPSRGKLKLFISMYSSESSTGEKLKISRSQTSELQRHQSLCVHKTGRWSLTLLISWSTWQ